MSGAAPPGWVPSCSLRSRRYRCQYEQISLTLDPRAVVPPIVEASGGARGDLRRLRQDPQDPWRKDSEDVVVRANLAYDRFDNDFAPKDTTPESMAG
jgi:hypothetical protein